MVNPRNLPQKTRLFTLTLNPACIHQDIETLQMQRPKIQDVKKKQENYIKEVSLRLVYAEQLIQCHDYLGARAQVIESYTLLPKIKQSSHHYRLRTLLLMEKIEQLIHPHVPNHNDDESFNDS